jgi:putative mRNA 3-end processing factor
MQRVRHRPDPPEVERAANGLRVRGHALYLEPRGRPPLGFLAHARGAPPVLPQRLVASGPTHKLLEAALPRALRRSATLAAAYGQAFALGSLRLTLHPAGHVLGSAQVHCEAEGLDLVYAGDIGGTGERAPATAEPFEQLTCDTLVIRAVYGHPRYTFPPRQALLERLQAFVERSLRDGKAPVIVAAAIGESQEVVRFLGGRRTLRLHPTAFRACEVYAAQGQTLAGFVRLEDEGDVVVLPPTARVARLNLGAPRICALSGRAVDGIAGADEAFALADHAGFDDLLECIRASRARRVLTVDGYAEDLARAARAIGIDAMAVREHHQLRLPGL